MQGKKAVFESYSMPYALSKMYHPVKIATDKNETFAVLVFNNKPSCEERMNNGKKESCEEIMLIFTEEDGFVEAEDYKHLLEEREWVFKVPFGFNALVSLF